MNTLLPVSGAHDAQLVALIEALSHYGLGVLRPHKHGPSGVMAPLPTGEVALEQDLRVRFVSQEQAASAGIPVAWRWNGTGVEVCGACCTNDNPVEPPRPLGD